MVVTYRKPQQQLLTAALQWTEIGSGALAFLAKENAP